MKHTNSDQESQHNLLDKDDRINVSKGVSQDFTATHMHDEKKKRLMKWIIIGVVIAIIVIISIVLPITLSKKDNPPAPPTPVVPHYNPYSVKDGDFQDTVIQFSGVMRAGEAAYNPDMHLQAFQKLYSENFKDDGEAKLAVDIPTIAKLESANNGFIKNIKFTFDMTDYRIARLLLTDNDNDRFSIPKSAVNQPDQNQEMRLDMVGFQYDFSESFGFRFVNPQDNDNVYVSTYGQSLVFMDKFIQMDFELPSQRVFGFGERVREFQLSEGTWTMWAIGQDSPYDDGTGRKNVYGVHPFVLVQGKNKDDFFGMFFRNANAQSPVLRYTPEGKSILSYITIGGEIEVYFFIHGSAKYIIQQYHSLIKAPQLPPFWSLGWQQASWKYLNQSMVEDVLAQYEKAKMPLDTMYLDIPYMKNYVDFTVDTDAFHDIQGLATNLHNSNQTLVLIIDAAISADNTTDPYYTTGNNDGIFIKSGIWESKMYNNNLILPVWPQKAVFVDWFHDKCMNLWSQGLSDLFAKVAYDGIWIDMNEPTGFMNGELKPSDATPKVNPTTILHQAQQRFLREPLKEDTPADFSWYTSLPANNTKDTYNLPFIPRFNDPLMGNYDNMTLSLNATHPGLNDELEYNVHSLYGLMMSQKTKEFLTQPNQYHNYTKQDNRPFVLTRSTFAGSGQYASHWLGDNRREWRYMNFSIAGIMNMHMFGIPHAGADVCGFFGEKKDDEMCARWVQLATFYPLARFHQNLTWFDTPSERSEPYLLQGDYLTWARQSMLDRYQYLRHMYTCLFEVSKDGGSCFDPLFYHFPTDDNVYNEIESSFIVGNAIKVTPVLNPLETNQTTFKSYFPSGAWVDLNTFKVVDTTAKGGDMVDLDAKQATVHVHLKPGSLIAFQDNSDESVTRINQLLTKPITLIANRDSNKYAYGSLFLDQGISRAEIDQSQFEYYKIHVQANSIQFMLDKGVRGTQQHKLDKVQLPNSPDLKDIKFACVLDMNLKPINLATEFDNATNTATLSNNNANDIFFNQIHTIQFGTSQDLDLCSPSSFQYNIKDGVIPDLGVNKVTLTLEHQAKTLQDIQLTIRIIQNNTINIKWSWAQVPTGYRQPVEVPDELLTTSSLPEISANLSAYVTLSDKPFSLQLSTRNDPSTTFFALEGLIFDQYLNWIQTRVFTEKNQNFRGIFGLGEKASQDFFMKDGVYSLWSRDAATPTETGQLPGNNMYGTHPFYMYKHMNYTWFGVLTKLAHAQDWWIKNDQVNGNVGIQTIATGGVGDIYVIMGTSPDNVVQNYFGLIGNPVLIPQWVLGWHQCRWGYRNTQMLRDVVKGYADNNMPLDAQWSDIDYLSQYRNFEYDQIRFKDLPDFVKELHAKNMKWVPIIDAGIAARPNAEPAYAAYIEGQKQDLFIKVGKEPFIGQVWPSDAVYPDYFHPDTAAWWKKYLSNFHDQVPFDGLWEDMNEASNFCDGFCYPRQKSLIAAPVQQKLKYIPSNRNLEFKSMPLDAQHANGYLQLDTHSYYGTQMVKVSHDWFVEQNKRTFIIERSSFAGLGKFGSRWLGDNFANVQNMGFSVSGIMLMNMFGIPLAGSDICGFIGDTTPDLCLKWHFVGSFYPFSRNHKDVHAQSQEPYLFNQTYSDGKLYSVHMRDAIRNKYQLIRYYYSELFKISRDGTGTFYKPLFFEFPDDQSAYVNVTYNIMLGHALKLSINPESLNTANTDYYFPEGKWCNIYDPFNNKCFKSPGQIYNFPSGLTDFQLHLREGFIIPFQNVTEIGNFNTSVELQNQPIDLHILGYSDDETTSWVARGSYINDDGQTLNYTNKYNEYLFSASSGSSSFYIRIINAQYATDFQKEDNCTAVNQNDYLSKIYFYNAKNYQNNKNYTVEGVVAATSAKEPIGNAVYDDASERLIFTATTPICMSRYNNIQLTPSA